MTPVDGRTQPWYGSWPPELKGEADMLKQQFKDLLWWHNIALWALGLFGAAIGIWLIVIPPNWINTVAASGLGSSVLSAVITSGIIGWFFQQRLAKDVFEASLGYLLPEELKPELKWIYDQQVLCIESKNEFFNKIFPK